MIAQKMIQGKECNVAALANHGELMGIVSVKKLFLTDKGKTWADVTIKNHLFELLPQNSSSLEPDGRRELEFIVETGTRKI